MSRIIFYAPQFPTTPPKKKIKTEVEVRFLFPTEVEKNYKKNYDTYVHFWWQNFFLGGTDGERDGMTDGQTDRSTFGQTDRMTDGHNIFIAAGERSLYQDSHWIVSRIIFTARRTD